MHHERTAVHPNTRGSFSYYGGLHIYLIRASCQHQFRKFFIVWRKQQRIQGCSKSSVGTPLSEALHACKIFPQTAANGISEALDFKKCLVIVPGALPGNPVLKILDLNIRSSGRGRGFGMKSHYCYFHFSPTNVAIIWTGNILVSWKKNGVYSSAQIQIEIENVSVLPMWEVKSNFRAQAVRHVSLGRMANARNVRLYFPYRQYTKLCNI